MKTVPSFLLPIKIKVAFDNKECDYCRYKLINTDLYIAAVTTKNLGLYHCIDEQTNKTGDASVGESTCRSVPQRENSYFLYLQRHQDM